MNPCSSPLRSHRFAIAVIVATYSTAPSLVPHAPLLGLLIFAVALCPTGFGGRKRLQKQNDASSAADMSGYRPPVAGQGEFRASRGGRGGGRGGRGGGGRGGGGNRPGKARRTASRGK